MTGDNQQSATNESARPRRKSNEKAIKDFVVIIGSLMMIMCFGMLLEVNIRGWNETGQRNSTIVMFVLLCLVVVLFSFYIHWRLKEVCSHLDEELSVAESNVSLVSDKTISDKLYGFKPSALCQ